MAPNNNGLHMLDYTMLWVHSLYEYTGQTQDDNVLESTYPKLLQFMEHLESYENPGTGLLDLPQKNWGETAYIDTFGYHNRYGQSTALNSMYYVTLNKASKLAELVGETERSNTWQKKAQVIKDAINSYLYLPSEHRYATNLYEGVPYEPTLYAQAWPLAYGIVPPDEVEYVVGALLELLSSDPSNPNVNIYGMYWVLKALGRTGYITEALDIIELYYGHIIDSGATTLWEHFNSYLHHNASLSHGWGGAPTWFLTTYVLGAKRSGPNAWTLKPALSGVDYASGTLPLRDGTVNIQWERESCQEAHITIKAEENSSGEVLIPYLNPSMKITLDDQTIYEDETGITEDVTPSSNGIIITINGGSHTINTHTDCLF
jgi:alpha-L-rhamnosidase